MNFLRYRLPETVRPLIEGYGKQLQRQLPGLVSDVYLVGSIALGEYNEKFSDIDFVTLLQRRMSPPEMKILSDIHLDLERMYPKGKMSGCYIPICDLGRVNGFDVPNSQYHEGVFHPEGLTELSSVTWWELKNHGIPILGDAPQILPFEVDWDLLVSRMMSNLNSYWAGWTSQPKRVLVLYSDWGIQWAVTGVLRQFYTLRENSITTKVRAAKYAVECVPERWLPLIHEAIQIREGGRKSLYWSRTKRLADAVNFLKYIIQVTNTIYNEKLSDQV